MSQLSPRRTMGGALGSGWEPPVREVGITPPPTPFGRRKRGRAASRETRRPADGVVVRAGSVDRDALDAVPAAAVAVAAAVAAAAAAVAAVVAADVAARAAARVAATVADQARVVRAHVGGLRRVVARARVGVNALLRARRVLGRGGGRRVGLVTELVEPAGALPTALRRRVGDGRVGRGLEAGAPGRAAERQVPGLDRSPAIDSEPGVRLPACVGVAAVAAVACGDRAVVGGRAARGRAAGHRTVVGRGRRAREGAVVGGRGGVGRRRGAVAPGDVHRVAATVAAGTADGVAALAVHGGPAEGVATVPAVARGDRAVVGGRAPRGRAAGHRTVVGRRGRAAERTAERAAVRSRRRGVGRGRGAVAAGDVDHVAATVATGTAVGVAHVAVHRRPALRGATGATVTGGDRTVVDRRATRGQAAGHPTVVDRGRRTGVEDRAAVRGRGRGVGRGRGAVAPGDVHRVAATGATGTTGGVAHVAVDGGPALRGATGATVARGDRAVVGCRATRGQAAGHRSVVGRRRRTGPEDPATRTVVRGRG